MAEKELYIRAGALSLCDKNEEILEIEQENCILRERVVPPYSEKKDMFRSYFNTVRTFVSLCNDFISRGQLI